MAQRDRRGEDEAHRQGGERRPGGLARGLAALPGEVAYVWHGALHAGTVAESLDACGFEVRAQIVWAEERLVLSRGHNHWQHEPCWYAVKGRGHRSGDRTQSTLWQVPSRDQDATTIHGTQKPLE